MLFKKRKKNKVLELEGDIPEDVLKSVVDKEYKYNDKKMWFGYIMLIIGFVLVIMEVKSDSTIIFTFIKSKVKLIKALPGITVIIFSALYMYFIKTKVIIKKK